MDGERGERVWQVTRGEAGTRLDAFLAARLGVGRAEVRRLLARGAVRRDGRALGSRHKGVSLAAGERLAVVGFAPPPARRARPDASLALPVLARGDGWLALDKPAGCPVHPLREDETGTVLNAVAALHPEVHGVGEGGLRSGVVHRLDVDTSGVLLVATAPGSWARLREAFASHRVEKVYRALVGGTPPETGALEVDLEVSRHRPARVRAQPAGRGGAGARRGGLRWRVLEVWDRAALVEVHPRTGFLHQIRASFAFLGHPVLGDRIYGDAAAAPRQMLHAAHVRFEEVEAASPDPADFAGALARLRGGAP